MMEHERKCIVTKDKSGHCCCCCCCCFFLSQFFEHSREITNVFGFYWNLVLNCKHTSFAISFFFKSKLHRPEKCLYWPLKVINTWAKHLYSWFDIFETKNTTKTTTSTELWLIINLVACIKAGRWAQNRHGFTNIIINLASSTVNTRASS